MSLLSKKPAELILALSMDPIIAKLVRAGVSSDHTAIHVEELKKFLFICAHQPGDWPMMSPEVDNAWHEAILNTPFYFGLCRALGAGYLHHQPKEGFDDPSSTQVLYEGFLTHYRSYFGEPPTTIWPIDIYQATFVAWCCRSSEPLPADDGEGDGDGDSTSYQIARAV